MRWMTDRQKEDFIAMICGEHIGGGQYRAVYEHKLDPELVVKIEAEGTFCNVEEWRIWSEVRSIPQAARWFAPCEAISPGGTILIQRRTTPVQLKRLPERIPYFFTDLKVGNWGRIGRRVVCHDYACHLLPINAGRMKKAEWWTE